MNCTAAGTEVVTRRMPLYCHLGWKPCSVPVASLTAGGRRAGMKSVREERLQGGVGPPRNQRHQPASAERHTDPDPCSSVLFCGSLRLMS